MKKNNTYKVTVEAAQATARGSFNSKNELFEFLKGIYCYFEGCHMTVTENGETVLDGVLDGTVTEYCNE